jgi:hypothetical protein
MLVYLYSCIVVLIIVTVCFIWYVATRKNPIENYTGKFPSGKIIQVEHKPYVGNYSYINIIDSLHHIYDISGGNTIPLQLQLPDIPKYGYLVIQAGTATSVGEELLYSIDLHVTLYHNSKGEIVYLYAGDTTPSKVLITIPKVVKNPIRPTPDTKNNNVTVPSNTTLWPSVIYMDFSGCSISNKFVQNSYGNVYVNNISQEVYYTHELNSTIATTPVFIPNNKFSITSDTIKNMNYINLFFYVNKDCYCITFYNDDDHIITIISNIATNITLTITCSNQSNITLNKNNSLYKVTDTENIVLCYQFPGVSCGGNLVI